MAVKKPKKPKSEKALKNDIRARMRQLFSWYSQPFKIVTKRAKVGVGLYQCEICASLTKKIQIDHVEPVVALDRETSSIPLDDYFDKLFCGVENLQAICPNCHDEKTKKENEIRVANRRKKTS